MVPGRHPSHAWNRWRYHYPQAAFPYQDLIDEQRRPRPARAGVRAAGHRRVRRRPVLGHRGALRQGRPGRPADGDPGHQRRPGGGHAARAAYCLVPQHLVLGCHRAPGRRCGPLATRSVDHRPPVPRHPGTDRRRGSRRDRPGAAVLRERDQRRAGCTAADPVTPYPKDGINDHVCRRRRHRQPGQHRHQGALWYRLTVRPGRDRGDSGCGCGPLRSGAGRSRGSRPRRADRSGCRLRPGDGRRAGRGRRVLRRADPGRRQRG